MRFAKWPCDRCTEEVDFGKKKIIFSGEAHYDLVAFGAQKTHTYILKSQRIQTESLFDAVFDPEE